MLHRKSYGLALLVALAATGCDDEKRNEDAAEAKSAESSKEKERDAKSKAKRTDEPKASRALVPTLKQIALGTEHGCALREDDVVVCWGKRTHIGHEEAKGQRPFQLAAVVPGLEKARAVAVVNDRSCAVARDRTVHCWEDGYGGHGPKPVEGLRDVADVAVGPSHACALHLDGTVSCWGSGGEGQLGDRKTDHGFDDHTVKVIGLADVTELALGRYHSCALKKDGTVHCWGGGDMKQLGNGEEKLSLAPIPVPGVNRVTQITAYDETTCALDEAGAVYCWGDGGLEDGRAKTVKGLPVAAEVRTGEEHRCARTKDGDLWCWGDASEGATGTGPARNDDSHAPMKVTAVKGVTAMALADDATCVVDEEGPICWGLNNAGRLGDGTSVEQLVPVEVPKLDDAVALSLDDELSCALRKSGDVTCWGGPRGGRDFNPERNYPGRDLPAQTDVAGLRIDSGNVFAIHGDGTVSRWEWYGARTDPARHVASLSGVERWLSVSYRSGLAQRRDGSVARIDIDYDNNAKTQPVHGIPAMTKIQTRTCYVPGPKRCEELCGINAAGKVQCARLEIPYGAEVTPSPVTAKAAPPLELANVVDIAVNIYGGWALSKDGTVTRWEDDDDGITYAPVKGVTEAVAVDTAHGINGACAVTKKGEVACWGDNYLADHGLLGDGSLVQRAEAAPVMGLTDAVSVTMSSQHACALRRGGKVSCWGRNDRDQVGAPSPGVRYDPVRVRF